MKRFDQFRDKMYGLQITRHFDCLVQDCSNSSGLAMESLQSCTKPSICKYHYIWDTRLMDIVRKAGTPLLKWIDFNQQRG